MAWSTPSPAAWPCADAELANSTVRCSAWQRTLSSWKPNAAPSSSKTLPNERYAARSGAGSRASACRSKRLNARSAASDGDSRPPATNVGGDSVGSTSSGGSSAVTIPESVSGAAAERWVMWRIRSSTMSSVCCMLSDVSPGSARSSACDKASAPSWYCANASASASLASSCSPVLIDAIAAAYAVSASTESAGRFRRAAGTTRWCVSNADAISARLVYDMFDAIVGVARPPLPLPSTPEISCEAARGRPPIRLIAAERARVV